MCKRVQEFIKWVVIIMIVIIIGQELYFLPNFGNKEVCTQLVVVDKMCVITILGLHLWTMSQGI